MTERITVERLLELDACEDQIELVRRLLERRGWQSARLTVANLRYAERHGCDVAWLISYGLIARDVACARAEWAYHHACSMSWSHDDTRAAACGDPEWAYYYARHVDRGPRDDTRVAACGDPRWTRLYARDVTPLGAAND